MGLLADMGIGILSAIFASHLFGIKFGLALLFGIIFALLPDLDFIIEWIWEGKPPWKLSYDHRDLLHFPIPYILIGSFIMVWLGLIWLFLFVFNSLWHFVHDSFGIGWGVKWLHPFSKKKYKLGKPLKIAKGKNWIKEIYLRPTPIAIIEFAIFVISLFTLFLYLK